MPLFGHGHVPVQSRQDAGVLGEGLLFVDNILPKLVTATVSRVCSVLAKVHLEIQYGTEESDLSKSRHSCLSSHASSTLPRGRMEVFPALVQKSSVSLV